MPTEPSPVRLARATLAAVKAQVGAAGGTMASIVKLNTYLVDVRHRGELGHDPGRVFRHEGTCLGAPQGLFAYKR